MAISAPPAGGMLQPAVDQRLWDELKARPLIALPVPSTAASKLIYAGSCLFGGWALADVLGSGAAVEFLDGMDATGSIVAEVAIAPGLGTPQVDSDTDVDSSATGAAGAIAATLPGVAAKTTFISGFEITGDGATASSIIAVTVTGILGGTKTYFLTVPLGALVALTPLIVEFGRPIPASALNTAIAVNVPSFGAGNTSAAVTAHGFQRSVLVPAQAATPLVDRQSLATESLLCRVGAFMRVTKGTVQGAVWLRI